MKKKSHNAAFFLSFFLPGAGLWYLGKWKHGFINLGVVFALGLTLFLVLPEETFFRIRRWIAIGCGAGSAGLAQAMAKQMNAALEAKETASKASDDD